MRKTSKPLWWKVFIAEYLQNGNNGKQAYLKAKPNVTPRTASVESAKLLVKPDFLAVLEESQAKIEQKIGMSLETWVQLLCDVAQVNLGQFLQTEEGSGDTQLIPGWKDLPALHAIEAISLQTTTQENGAVVQRVMIKKDNKMKALEILGKAAGYLTEKLEHTGSVEVVNPYAQPEKD